MILIMPNMLVLLAMITVQVSASKVSATMTATTQPQQVSHNTDFILMTFSYREIANLSPDMHILVGIWEFLYEENY